MRPHLFEFCPVPLWIEDFSAVKQRVEELKLAGVENCEAYLRRHPEVILECARLVRVLDVNPAAVELHRAASREALLAGLDQIFTEQSTKAFGRELCGLISGLAVVHERGEVRAFDGELLEVDVSVGLDPAFPDWSRVYVATVDRTRERQAMEKELSLQERLMRSQRAESLGVLAGGVAHDFNNILMAILGQVELGLSDLDLDSPLRTNLQAIEEQALRAAELSRQMLAYSGRGHFLVDELDLNELVRTSLGMLRASCSPGVELRLHLVEPAPRVRADAGQLQQVLVNLVTNANEALTGGRGWIEVTTGRTRLGEAELLAARGLAPDAEPKPGSYAYLAVRDEGVGMDAEVQARVFDPFFTTKFAGRGLGLAAVHGIARGHGGVVHMESAADRGTRMRFALPALEPAPRPAPVAPPSQPPSSHPLLAGRVLVAEDEPPVRRVLVAMLSRLGLEATEAEDGVTAVAAIAAAEAAGAPFDLALLDLTMPRLDGLGVLERIRADHPGLPVVLTSGYDRGEVMREAGEVAGFLPKPYSRTELEALLGTVLEPA